MEESLAPGRGGQFRYSVVTYPIPGYRTVFPGQHSACAEHVDSRGDLRLRKFVNAQSSGGVTDRKPSQSDALDGVLRRRVEA